MFDFSSIKKSVEAISAQYRTLRKELDKIESAIPLITGAPTNKKDICQLVEQWADQSGANFSAAVAGLVTNRYQRGEVTPYDGGFFELLKNTSGDVNVAAMDQTMMAIFGPQIKQAILDAINRMPWPDEGLTRADRALRLSKLRDRQTALHAELSALVKSADEAGIEIQPYGA